LGNLGYIQGAAAPCTPASMVPGSDSCFQASSKLGFDKNINSIILQSFASFYKRAKLKLSIILQSIISRPSSVVMKYFSTGIFQLFRVLQHAVVMLGLRLLPILLLLRSRLQDLVSRNIS